MEQLTLTTPPGAGTVDVTVMSAGGTSAIVSTDLFTYLPVPTVTGISPASGPLAGGNLVAIDGTGLSDVTEVDFGGIPDFNITPFDANTIYVDAPAGASLGTVDVIVTTGGGTSAVNPPADQYTYLPAPTVSGLIGTSGAIEGGTPVTISGTGLSGITAVDFGNKPADLSTLTYNADGSVTVISPASPTGDADTVDVTVTTYDGMSAINPPADQFSYTLAPYITSLDTTVGLVAGGTSVTIYGDDLEGVTAVSFGNSPAGSFTDNGDGTITAVSPAGAVGTVNVFVTTPAGASDAVTADQFTYGEFPSITSVSPPTGSTNGGTQVTITGLGLANATEVNFGSFGAAFTFVSDTDGQIVVESPQVSSSGTVDVTVMTPLGTSVINPPDDQFTYVAPPTITSLDTTNGSVYGSTYVTITGTGLAGATAVDFGSNPVAGIVSNTDNQGIDTMVVISPEATGDTPGPVDVTVITPYGLGSYSSFLYWAPPSIIGISPASGTALGNTAVTISGDNLANVTAVNFGIDPAFSFSYNQLTDSITAYSPAGSPSTVDITLVGPGGTSQTSGADQFTYLAVPSVTSISPAAGPEAGGTTVTILGTGFSTATEVDFNGSASPSFTINSDTSISATSPDLGITGGVGVTVLTAGGTSPTDTFTYDATPSVTGVSPAWGSANGTTVTITGTGLDDATAIYFGSNPGTITSYSPGQLQALAPAGSLLGMVHVTVVAPGGTSATSSADWFSYIGAPVTAAASYSVTEGSILSIPASTGVLATDTDPQGLPLTASLLAEPLDGTLGLNSDGSFTYTPNSGYVGTDAFVYQASNGYLDSNPTFVTLTVNEATGNLPSPTVTPTASGFLLTFARPVNQALVHLYDGQNGTSGNLNDGGTTDAAEQCVVVTGLPSTFTDPTGQLNGSLVWISSTEAEWINTDIDRNNPGLAGSNALPAGTYQITLSSLTPNVNGWYDLSGNGFAGGIATASITVGSGLTSTPAVDTDYPLLSVPSFCAARVSR